MRDSLHLGLVIVFGMGSLAGCSCDEEGTEADLRVEGEHAYVRCLARPAPTTALTRAGQRFEVDGRTLRLADPPDEVRLAVMGGAGPEPLPADAIEALEPDLVLVIGDLDAAGDDPTTALAAAIEVPVLVLPGGVDSLDGLPESSASGDTPVDLSPFRRVVLGPATLVPLAGAPEGRYGAGADACGFGADDVEGFDYDTPATGTTLLVSWWPPERPPLSLGVVGVDVGDPLVGQVAEAAGATGGLYGQPAQAAGRAEGAGSDRFAMVVAPGAGPWPVHADGRRVPSGPRLVVIDESGVTTSP